MSSRTISFNFDKKKAITLVKKAISGKAAIVKDNGDFLKVGTPPFMMADITIKDNEIEVAYKGSGGLIGETCASEIEMAVQEYQESLGGAQESRAPQAAQPQPTQQQASQSKELSPEDYLEYQNKAIALLKQYKELYDNEILTKEEFEAKKADLLNFINGMTRKK